MMSKPPAKLYLVITNISERCNIRSLIASGVAFGAEVLMGENTSPKPEVIPLIMSKTARRVLLPYCFTSKTAYRVLLLH